MSPWEILLERPHSRDHFVQLYQTDDQALARNTSHYFWEGLRCGDGVLAIVAAEHQRLICLELERMGADLSSVLGERQLVFRDARTMLNDLMHEGHPERHSCERTMVSAVRQVRAQNTEEFVRAYSEMPAVLWSARQFAATVELEQCCAGVLDQCPISLYCAYCIDIFGRDEGGDLEDILCAHTHLVPAEPDGKLDAALSLAMDELLGQEAGVLRSRIKSATPGAWAVMPTAESMVLWLRKYLPGDTTAIMARTREHYLAMSTPIEVPVSTPRPAVDAGLGEPLK